MSGSGSLKSSGKWIRPFANPNGRNPSGMLGNGRISANGLFRSQSTKRSPFLTRLAYSERCALASLMLIMVVFMVINIVQYGDAVKERLLMNRRQLVGVVGQPPAVDRQTAGRDEGAVGRMGRQDAVIADHRVVA